MSHSQDLEAPTIFVEAPPEDEQGDLIDGGYTSLSLNSTFHEHSPELQALFLQMYPEASPSSMNISGTSSAGFDQSLFPASFDQSSSTGQISPLITAGLREGSAGNVFLAPNDQSSPIDPAWSPASSFEGDVFSDGWSDGSSAWSPSVQSSSPSPSSPSLSPLNTSFNNIILSDDNVAGPALYRQRSNSFTRSTDSPNDLSPRPRSSSFTDVASLAESTQIFSSTTQSVIDDYTLFQHTSDYVEQFSQIPQWSSSVQSDSASNFMGTSFDSTFGPRVPNSSFDETQWNMNQPVYSPPIGPPPSHSHGSHGRSLSTHLTVPSSLQRRDAHRRSHSHTGVQQDSIRGRKRFSPTGDLSSRHSSQSREPSPTSPYQQLDFTNAPYLNFGPTVQTQLNNSDSLTMLPSNNSPQSDFLSPTSTSSNSPQSPSSHIDFFSATNSSPLVGAVDPFFSPSSSSGSSQLSLPITIQGHDSEPELIPVQYSGGVARRHSYAGSRSPSGSRSASPLPESSSNASDSLHRAVSDPIGQNRRRRAPTVPRKYPGLLKPAKEVDEAGPSYPDSSMMINVPIEGVHSAPAPAEFKTVVGSSKIVEASKARRKNEAKFKCEICHHRFTAKHNLQNHMNSHSNKRPHECQKCGNTFTTRGTHARHETICTGRAVRKRL